MPVYRNYIGTRIIHIDIFSVWPKMKSFQEFYDFQVKKPDLNVTIIALFGFWTANEFLIQFI